MDEKDWAEIRRFRRWEIFWFFVAIAAICVIATIGERGRAAEGKKMEVESR